MSFAYPLVGLVTILCLFVFLWMGIKTGQSRSKHETPAPAMQGPDELMRVIRVHGNTLEGLMLFLPALWIFAALWGDQLAAIVGVFFPVARLLYAKGYYAEAGKRSTGFMIGFMATAILLIGSLVGLVMAALSVYG